MKRLTLRAAALILTLAAHQTVFSYRITYNSGPTDAKSNINLLLFTDAKDYAKLVKVQKATDTAQKILNAAMTAQEYLTVECAPEFAPEEVVLDQIGDIIIGWLFGIAKAIETDIITIHKHTNQKPGDVASWYDVPTNKLDPQGWIYLVVVIAKGDQGEKGQVVLNMRIQPDSEFGLNIDYKPGEGKKGKGGTYICKIEPTTKVDNVSWASYILNKTSCVRLYGPEVGTSAQASNIIGSLNDYNISPNSPFCVVKYDTNAKEYSLPNCPKMKTFIQSKYVDAWPAWQKFLGQAFAVQAKQPGNPAYGNYNNITDQDMAKKVQGWYTYGGGPANATTISNVRTQVIKDNNNSTNICQ
jgi:hypothetical protein